MPISKSRRVILIALISINLLLTVGLAFALMFNKPIAHSKMAARTNKLIVANVPKETLKKNAEQAPANYNWEEVKPLDPDRVISSPPPEPEDLPVIAGIAIPDLGINMPIFKGVDDQSLYYGAGTTKENQTMGQGNYGLASHHVFGIVGATSLLFSPLEHAQEGQEIYLTDKEYVYTYTIISVKRITPTQSDILDDPKPGTDPLVTLITCTDNYARGRIAVQGALVKKTSYDHTDQKIKNAFKQKYNIWQQ